MFGERIKNLRIERRLTQQEVADALGVSKNTIYSWENGVRSPTLDMLSTLADFFGVSADYLLGRENVPEHVSPSTLAARNTEGMPLVSEERVKELIAEAFKTFVTDEKSK